MLPVASGGGRARALAAALATAASACGAPPGAQGDPAVSPETWGPAALVVYDGSASGVAASDAQAALDEVLARADAVAPIAEANRSPFRCRAFGSGADFGGYAGARLACGGSVCGGSVPYIRPCTSDDLARSYVAGAAGLGDGGWVFDPASCRGLTTTTSAEMGLAWGPAVGFLYQGCETTQVALMCCG